MVLPIKIIIFTFICSVAFAAPEKALNGLSLAKEIIGRYQKAPAISAQVEKTVVMGLLEEKTISKGQLLLSQGRLNLKFDKPNASLLIMNNEMIWLVTPGVSDQDKRLQVLKIKAKDFMRQTKAPVALLLGKASAWDKLTIKGEAVKDELISMKLAPKTPQALGDVLEVEIEIDKHKNDLRMLSLRDELDNVTQFKFTDIKKIKKANEKDFSYRPPKEADVTEYEQ